MAIVSFDKNNINCGNRYWFDITNDVGKAQLAVLLTAQAAERRVWVNGDGSCLSSYPYNNAYHLKNIKLY